MTPRAHPWLFVTPMAICVIACGAPQPDDWEGYAGEIRSREVSRGRDVFHHVCAACHEGRVNPVGYRWEPGHMRFHIRRGNGSMPPISTQLVDESDLEAVLAYLTTIDAVAGVLPSPPGESHTPGAVEEATALDAPFGQ